MRKNRAARYSPFMRWAREDGALPGRRGPANRAAARSPTEAPAGYRVPSPAVLAEFQLRISRRQRLSLAAILSLTVLCGVLMAQGHGFFFVFLFTVPFAGPALLGLLTRRVRLRATELELATFFGRLDIPLDRLAIVVDPEFVVLVTGQRSRLLSVDMFRRPEEFDAFVALLTRLKNERLRDAMSPSTPASP